MALPFQYFYGPKIISKINDMTSVFLDNLSHMHQFNNNHSEIVSRLIMIAQKQSQRIPQYSTTIVNYLHCNITNNIQILDSLHCLNLIYPFISYQSKRIINILLTQKYCSKTEYCKELEKIKGFNMTLIEPFFKLTALLTKWFLSQIQEKQYNKVQLQEVQYLLNFMHLITQYEFQTEICFQEEQIEKYLLTLYRILSQDQIMAKTIIFSNDICDRIISILFYFMANYQFNLSGSVATAKILNYSVGEIINMIRDKRINMDDQMIQFLLPRVRKAAMFKDNEQERERIIDIIMRTTINMLVTDWSMEREVYWLWKCKTICDLLKIDPIREVKIIEQIQIMAKQITKIFNSI